jgi:transcription-repair coupling factor (superfamily II helicase)
MAEKLGIETIDRRGGFLNVKFHKDSRVDPQRLMSLVSGTPGTQFSPAGVLRIPVDGNLGPGELLGLLRSRMAELLREPVPAGAEPGHPPPRP